MKGIIILNVILLALLCYVPDIEGNSKVKTKKYEINEKLINSLTAQKLWRPCDPGRVSICVTCRPTCEDPKTCNLSLTEKCTQQCVCEPPSLEAKSGECVRPDSLTCLKESSRRALTRDDGDIDEDIEIEPANPTDTTSTVSFW